MTSRVHTPRPAGAKSATSKHAVHTQDALLSAADAAATAIEHEQSEKKEEDADSQTQVAYSDAGQAQVVHGPADAAVIASSAADVPANDKNKDDADKGAAGAAAKASPSALPWVLGGIAGIGLLASASKGNNGHHYGNTPAPAPAPVPVPVPADVTAPVFSSAGSANFDENLAAGSVVYTARATDAGGIRAYTLGGADAAAFTIDASTGEVRIKATPDFETKASYVIEVTATDAAGNVAKLPLTFKVNDVDDTPPAFSQATAKASVDENVAAGTVVFKADAKDDGGAVRYALKGGDASAFTIDALTGEVKLVASPDFEAKASYTFEVIATDVKGNTSAQAVTLSINDLDEVAPVFTSGATATISENVAAGTLVYTAKATDNVAVTGYTLSGIDAAAFTIDAVTGEVKLAASPDFETQSSYAFDVTATDAAGNSTTQSVALSIDDVREGKSTLEAGDIAIVAMFASNPDKFAFVALTDIAAGTVINFTDNGWTAAGAFRAGEGVWTWTSDRVVLTGTVVSVDAGDTKTPAATIGSVSKSGSGDFAAGGDSIIAYQGPATSPTLLYAVNDYGAHVWQADATNSNTSALPTGLENGRTAVALTDLNNTAYKGPTTGTKAELLAAISDYTNWSGDNSALFPVPTAFSVAAAVPVGSMTFSTTVFNESNAYDGAISEGILVALSGARFAGAVGSDMAATGLVTAQNLPAGLVLSAVKVSDGSVLLSLAGHAAAHANVNDVANLGIKFVDGAFAGGVPAIDITGSTQTGWKIDFGDSGAPMSEQDFMPNAGTAFGSSDASTAIAQNANWMVVGDDEHNVLRIYPRNGGTAVLEWNYAAALGIGTSELDLEASTRIGDTLYFIGSHSNKKGGAEADNREYLFSVKMSGSGAQTTFTEAKSYHGLETALATWDSTNAHGLGANHFGFTASSANGVVPEAKNGFSIEGMTASLDGTALYIGFRAPLADTTARTKAVMISITNADAMIQSGAEPVFGAPFELDLGGRGIRSIERAADGSGYLILAGPSAGQTAANDDFQLFSWDGVASHAPVKRSNTLDTLLDAHGGSFETLVDVQSIHAGTMLQLLQDNGDTVWRGQTKVSKDLAPASQHFLGNWVQLGEPAGADTTAPHLISATPADDGTGVRTTANIVLVFDENVVAGTGAFELRDGNGNLIEALAASGSRVQISGTTVTLDPVATLGYASNYQITVTPSALTDTSGNPWAASFNGTNTPAILNFTTEPLPATTVLNPGDLIFLGINTDAVDAYAFALMKDIVAGTQIGFTDRNYVSASGFPSTGEAAFMWTADKDYAAGTIITLGVDTNAVSADKGTLIGMSGGLSTSAETVYAFQGSIADLAVEKAGAITVDRFIASINAGTAAGEIPSSLTAAGAVQHIDGDNGVYNGSMDRTDLGVFAARVKDMANWKESDTIPQPLDANKSMFTETVTKISTIQGNGFASPMDGAKRVLVEAMVTGVKPGLNGFYLQEEAADSDGNDATSEGIFVYYGTGVAPVTVANIGDIVRFYADVKEFNNLTEMTFVYNMQIVKDGSVADLPAPVEISLPLADAARIESLEGMLVHVTSGTPGGSLVVTDNFNLGQYGQVTLTSDTVQKQFTEISTPNKAAFDTFNAATKLDQIILDDSSGGMYPAAVWGRGGQPLSASNPLRAGDSVNGITGFIDQYTDSKAGPHETSYRLQAQDNAAVNFTGAARPTANDAWASLNLAPELKVVSANVLNLFTTLGTASFNTPYGNAQSGRGANNATEYQRQLDKVVSALIEMNGDVYGLEEIQNNGFGDGTSAIDALVDALNARAGATVYDYIKGPFNNGTPSGAPAVGDDAITTAIVYKIAAVMPVGQAATPDTSVYNAFGATYGNRPPLAQTFKAVADGEEFTLVVNHFKSKGSVNDPDLGDGQGANTVARMKAAEQLIDWLATHPTGSSDPDVIMVGDYNAYSKEDVVTFIDAHGFDKVSHGDSYAFNGLWGSLDHAFASDSLVAQGIDAVKWANNAQESVLLDYNLENKAAGNSYYAPDAYRASDHNPVLIGLKLGAAASAPLISAPVPTAAEVHAEMMDMVMEPSKLVVFSPVEVIPVI